MDDKLFCVAPLFVPGDRPERYIKAANSGTDALIIDLEDAVAPDKKAAARAALCQPGALPSNVNIFIRVNGRSTPWHQDDVSCAAGLNLAGVILPKAESADEIKALSAMFPGLAIIALIETAAGLAAARSIAGSPATARLAFGSIDFCADLGLAHTKEALLMARSELVLDSRLGGCPPPLDGVTTAIADDRLVEDDARYASSLGFGGKLCIHPAQITPAMRGFAPAAAEIAWAERVLAIPDGGAALVDGTMVDAPVRARARQIRARSAAGENLRADQGNV